MLKMTAHKNTHCQSVIYIKTAYSTNEQLV